MALSTSLITSPSSPPAPSVTRDDEPGDVVVQASISNSSPQRTLPSQDPPTAVAEALLPIWCRMLYLTREIVSSLERVNPP